LLYRVCYHVVIRFPSRVQPILVLVVHEISDLQ
jgi:hypothetical protein